MAAPCTSKFGTRRHESNLPFVLCCGGLRHLQVFEFTIDSR